MRILVVEDDFISRRLLCRYLEAFGDCDVAQNGYEAVMAFRRGLERGKSYDLICLDIMMPEMGGLEALAEMRNIESKKGLAVGKGAKIIMTTAMEDPANVRTAFSSHADGYVLKPVEKKKLIATLTDLGLVVESTL